MPYKALEYLGNFGNQLGNVEREATGQGEWGNPQLSPMAPSREGPTLRGQLPNWSPGEFDEWKQAHMLNIPTRYGQIMQRRYNQRGRLPYPGQNEIEANGIASMYPALDMLRRGSR